MGRTAFGRNRVELLEADRITLQRRPEKNVLAIGGPSCHGVRTAAEGQLARFAAFGGNQIYIEVAAILRRECDPVAIGRKVRI